MSSRARTALRLLLPGAIVGALAVALVAGSLARSRAIARAEALALLDGARDPLERERLGEFVLESQPGLGEAYAVRAVGRAQLGKLDEAREDVARSDGGVEAERATAWIAFREGRVAEGLAFARAHGRKEEIDELEFALGLGPSPAWTWILGDHSGGSYPYRYLERTTSSASGSIEALHARLYLTRLLTLELDDEQAQKLLALPARSPPFDLALAEQAKRELARIRRDDVHASGPALLVERKPTELDDSFDRWLARHALARAELLLERDRLFVSEPDRARAIEGLRRALVVDPKNTEVLSRLVRALARDPEKNEAEIRERAAVLAGTKEPSEAAESARGLWRIGDLAGARRVLERPKVRDESVLVGASLGYLLERGRLDPQVLAWLRDRPWEARRELEVENAGEQHEADESLAQARARQDPLGALAVCPDVGECVTVLATVFSEPTPELVQKLEARGVSKVRAAELGDAVSRARTELLEKRLWK